MLLSFAEPYALMREYECNFMKLYMLFLKHKQFKVIKFDKIKFNKCIKLAATIQ